MEFQTQSLQDSRKLELPIQSPPVVRSSLANQPHLHPGGVVPAQTDVCGDLTGLAQQMCYANYYGVSM